MIWHFCRPVSTLKRRSGTARHQSSLVIQRVEQSTAVTVNGFTGTYVRMTAIMIRSNRIMHGRCHDNDAAKRGQIVVTQFRVDDWHPRKRRCTKSIGLAIVFLNIPGISFFVPVLDRAKLLK